MTGQAKILWAGILAMAVIVTASNILVQYPINEWLTFGAFTYPIAFLVTDVCNRTLGPAGARKVVYVGFAFAVLLSLYLADPRIALASGSAFLVAQLLDVSIFDRLRQQSWWIAPLASSTLATALDTALFFSIAFYGTDVLWVKLGLGDFAVKMGIALVMLVPFRMLFGLLPVFDRRRAAA